MSQPNGFLGLDRKAMEEERLARLAAKRKRTDEATTSEMPESKATRVRSSEAIVFKPSNKPELRESSLESRVNPTELKSPAQKFPALQYPHGAVKRTWAQGYMRQNDIKIEEVLQKNDLRCAVVSSWQWDFDWLVSKIDPGKTKFVFIMEAKSDPEKEKIIRDFQGLEKRIRLCFPPMSKSSFSRMHSKLMLLFYNDYLRIAIPSANPVPFDWGETGSMENSVFLIDLPRLPEAKHGHENKTSTNFARNLLRFLRASEVYEDITESVLRYDFSATSGHAFISSIPGSYAGGDESNTGLFGLSTEVAQLGLSTSLDKPLEIDFAASSVGSLNNTQINDFKECLRGLKDPSKNSGSRADSVQRAPGAFRILFPTVETVKESNGSFNNGGTIFMSPSATSGDQFPTSLLRNYQSTRKGLLSHNKLIFARSPSSAFFYIGSANISQSAWGRITGAGRSKTPKMTISNWECGVLVPVVKFSVSDDTGDSVSTSVKKALQTTQLDGSGVLPMSVFEDTYHVPFEWPAKAYGKNDEPWSANMQHQ